MALLLGLARFSGEADLRTADGLDLDGFESPLLLQVLLLALSLAGELSAVSGAGAASPWEEDGGFISVSGLDDDGD